jgi:hypothetical protein
MEDLEVWLDGNARIEHISKWLMKTLEAGMKREG